MSDQIQNASFMYPPNPWKDISQEGKFGTIVLRIVSSTGADPGRGDPGHLVGGLALQELTHFDLCMLFFGCLPYPHEHSVSLRVVIPTSRPLDPLLKVISTLVHLYILSSDTTI